MIRLQGRDDLKDKVGVLKAGFDGARLRDLAVQLVKKLPENEHARANGLLLAFLHAATDLKKREAMFNSRARSRGRGLTENLRSPQHLGALRDFSALSEALTELHPEIGAEITGLALDGIRPPQRLAKKLIN